MITVAGLLLVLSIVPGCSILQDAYEERAMKECNSLPTRDERLACSRAADDAERARRQNK